MSWAPGIALTPLTKPAITTAQLKAYADASGDRNPIHLDEAYARASGFPSVIVHGMLSMAFMGDLVRLNFTEGQFHLHRLKARFRKVTFPGDVLTCSGVVREKDAEGRLHLSLEVKNQQGEITTDGTAEVSEIT